KEKVPLKTEYEDVADELARNGDFVADYIRATNNNEEVKSPNSPSLSPEATDYLNSYAFKMRGIVDENNRLYSALSKNHLLQNMEITTEEQDGILIFEQLCDGNFPTGGTKLLRRPWGAIVFLDTIEDIRQFHGNKSSHTYW